MFINTTLYKEKVLLIKKNIAKPNSASRAIFKTLKDKKAGNLSW